jgi:ABC-type antimicrobial peptide transport system permease subunit
MTLNSATFTLSDSHDLLDFKEYLTDYGYSQVQKVSDVREFIVLKDAAFNNSIASVKQQIHYINTLYPFLYVLVGIIAISVSYLLVVSRKNEFATMRGLGAPRIRSFFSFFFEQSFLCILGISIGFLIWVPIMSEPTPLHMMLVAGFIICYFTGSIISITIMNQANVLTILSNRE